MSNNDYESPNPLTLSLQMGATMIAVGGLVFVLMPLTRATSGASRSAHIKWEERSAEIENVILSQGKENEAKREKKEK
jgi:hypothetical protein